MNQNQKRRLEKAQNIAATERFLPVTFLTMHRTYHWGSEKYQVCEKGTRLILQHESKRGVMEWGMIRFLEDELGLKLRELMPNIPTIYVELYGCFLLAVQSNYGFSKKALETTIRGFMKIHKSKKSTDQLMKEMSKIVEVEVR